MKTVGELKKAGLVFVEGDFILSVTSDEKSEGVSLINDCAVKHGLTSKFIDIGQGFYACENWVLKEFAWRENTGVKPEFSGAIDAIVGVGDDSEKIECAPIDDFSWDLDHSYPTVKWRPSLNQPSAAKPDTKQSAEEKRMDIIGQNGNDGLHYDNTAQQVEVIVNNNTQFSVELDEKGCFSWEIKSASSDKPIFTQEMADAGELPPVGSLFIDLDYNENKQVLALAHHLGKVVYASDYDDESQVNYFHADQDCCRALDTRTGREKAIDEMLKDSRCNGSVIEICIERLYDADYRKC